MKIYRVVGSYKFGNRWLPFTKEIAAKNKEEAIDQYYSLLGSYYGKKRREIKVEDASSIPFEEAKDSRARYKYRKFGEKYGE